MVASVAFNYMSQTNAAGTFNVTSTGWVQGLYIDDPTTRHFLTGGVLAQTETIPMIGGVGIYATIIPNGGTNPPDGTQGGLVGRATNGSAGSAGCLVGFSVFNQIYSMVTTPQSPVPAAGSGMQVGYFRLGSRARIVVACSPALAAAAPTNVTNYQCSWDYVNQQLIPYIPAYVQTNTTATAYNQTTGILTLTFASAPFGASYATAGAYLGVSGIVGTGAGAPSLNGSWPITSVTTSGTVINVQATPGLVASGLSGAVLAAGGGLLAINALIEINASNNMTVNYNSVTNAFTWNYNGTVAVIEL